MDLSLLDRLAASIDYPIQHKLVVNNGPKERLDDWIAAHPGWVQLSRSCNQGLACAWNMAPAAWLSELSWLIVNEDCWFNPGQLRTICGLADAHLDKHIILSDKGFECFVWTRAGVREVGLFDENFWPIYYEDYDYWIRLALAGNNFISANCRVNHGKPKTGGDNYEGMIKGCGLFNREYLLRKWGDLQKPMWPTPFNVPN